MRIYVAQGDKGRELEGGFKIYGSRKDLASVADQINKFLSSSTVEQGWVEIQDTSATGDITILSWNM